MIFTSTIVARIGVAALASISIAASIAAQDDSAKPAPTPAARDVAAKVGEATPDALGWYRSPAIRGDVIVFVSEGDLWRVGPSGGSAMRLTTHAGEEGEPSISPDGTTVAFIASYEGPSEVYTMPIDGGLPRRRTFDAARVATTGWTPDGRLVYASTAGATLPSTRTFVHDLATDERELVPLAQCADAAFLDANRIVFTRLRFQGSHTDRYVGGTAQQLWSFTIPAPGVRGDEAVLRTGDYPGTSRRPLVHRAAGGERIVFTTDRSGRMNLWSMRPDGSDLVQHTKHADYDIGSSAIDGDRVVYQFGPDLRMLDLATGADRALAITLPSDFDQTRERWVRDPVASATSVRPSPNGDRIVVTTRGRIFVVPTKVGRVVDVDPRSGIRYREAAFMPDGTTLIAMSDESGELELTTLPANGRGGPARLTQDGDTVRWRAVPSPDGKRIAHTDKRLRLRVFDVEKKTDVLVEENAISELRDLAWSPDSQFLAYTASAENLHGRVRIWCAADGAILDATTDRYDSYNPAWSPDGAFLYLQSDRTFQSLVGSPWGPRQPEPYFEKTGKIYQLALKAGTRSPFQPNDEVYAAEQAAEKKRKDEEAAKAKEAPKDAPKDAASDTAQAQDAPQDAPKDEPKDDSKEKAKAEPDAKPAITVVIDREGLASRLQEVPAGVHNFGPSPLVVTDKAIFWLASDPPTGDGPARGSLWGLAIGNEKPEPKLVLAGVSSFEATQDRTKLLVSRDRRWFVIDAAPAPASIDKPDAAVDVGGVAMSVIPRDEWRQMLIDAWRMLRDYFYDPNMHGTDWRAMLDKYLPWVERVRSREELSNVLMELTGELSALHHFVFGGDLRRGQDRVLPATLGADLERDAAAGGWRVVSIPAHDPDEPSSWSPLAAPTVGVGVGDVILSIDGVSTLSVPHPSMLLRNKAGRQTLLGVLPKPGPDGAAKPERSVIVRPLSPDADQELRYRSWELSRRDHVEAKSDRSFGYIHLRAMGGEDFSSFVRDFYPVFHRSGLVLDVRDNNGGNIDSWILSRLMRTAWMFWSQPVGRGPMWNMQYAFRGHMVVLCNENTASDGEAFAEGFRRLGLGKVFGTRTWGGEIWLTSSNLMVDGGAATAGEFGVFDEKGVWLIEGHGVDPDVVVDNPPHATFLGEDRQLDAAIEHLKKLVEQDPRPIPPVPPHPRKAAP